MAAKRRIKSSDSSVNIQKKPDLSLVETLLKEIHNERDKALIQLFAETGCTSSEIVNIHTQDVDFENNILIIRSEKKHQLQRKLSLSLSLSLNLQKILDKKKEFLFYTKKSPQLRTRSVRKIFDKYSSLLGQKITTSDLRKECISKAFLDSELIPEIKHITGIKRLDKKNYLKKKEFEEIKKEIQSERDKLIFDIIFETGCKLNEITKLKIEDIEFAKHSLIIKTAEKKRTSIISERLSLQLKIFAQKNKMNKNDFLLSSRQHKTISNKRIFQIVKKYSSSANLGFNNPTMLRYSHIAHSFSEEKSFKEISKQTGIKTLKNFNLYGSLSTNKYFLKHKNE